MADSLLLEALATIHNAWRASAYLNGAQTAATATIINLDTIVYDPNGNFNIATHLYTAPVDGIYTVSWRLCTSTANIDICSGIRVNGAEALRGSEGVGTAATFTGSVGSGTLILHAGDTVSLYNAFSSVSAVLVTNAVQTYFNIMWEHAV